MSDFVQALAAKISKLEEYKADLLSEMSEVDAKISLLKELQADEISGPLVAKKRGRPPKSVKDKGTTAFPMDPAVVAEASKMEGTDPGLAARIAARPGRRTGEPNRGYGPGVRVGTKDEVIGGARKSNPSNATISVEDDSNEPV